MVAQERQSLGVEFIDAPRALAPVADQSSVLEHAEVLGNRGPRYRQSGGQFMNGARMRADSLEDGEARRVAEGGEPVS